MTGARVSDAETVVVVADPPWPHANGSRTNSGKSPKYALMNLAEIAALGPAVRQLAGGHAVLYLWVTGPHLPGGVEVLSAWGFIYRSFHVWRKRRIACGYWSRSNSEIVLVGERGRPSKPTPGSLMPSAFDGDPADRGHSSKPDTLHGNAERLWPGAAKVELFAREAVAGWRCYGSDLGSLLTPSGVQEVGA